MLLIKRALPIGDEEIESYIAAWKKLLDATGDESPHEIQRRLFDHMYENLNILDGKTNSLIQLTGILVASYAFTATAPSVHFDNDTRWLFATGVVYAAFAIFLCLRVIWVHWSSGDDLVNADQQMHSLIAVRSARTVKYRRAWTFSAISLIALATLLLNQTIIHVLFPHELLLSVVGAHLGIIYVYDDISIGVSNWLNNHS